MGNRGSVGNTAWLVLSRRLRSHLEQSVFLLSSKGMRIGEVLALKVEDVD
jgi:hypothetical protein